MGNGNGVMGGLEEISMTLGDFRDEDNDISSTENEVRYCSPFIQSCLPDDVLQASSNGVKNCIH